MPDYRLACSGGFGIADIWRSSCGESLRLATHFVGFFGGKYDVGISD